MFRAIGRVTVCLVVSMAIQSEPALAQRPGGPPAGGGGGGGGFRPSAPSPQPSRPNPGFQPGMSNQPGKPGGFPGGGPSGTPGMPGGGPSVPWPNPKVPNSVTIGGPGVKPQ